MNVNEEAFLRMLAVSEGTDHVGDRGYNVLVGGNVFSSYARHPGVRVALPRRGAPTLYSTAAGRYQFKLSTWNDLAAKLALRDFSPDSQDLACLELIRQRGAQADVRSGNIEVAIDKCRAVWASLPGAGYGQRENSMHSLLDCYREAGGVMA